MKTTAYWWEEAPRNYQESLELPSSVDVAVIGGGSTGLCTALTLAKAGVTVIVLEAGVLGSGASTLNGRFRGALISANTRVIKLKKNSSGFEVQTSAGNLLATKIAICTNGYTEKVTQDLRRRILFGSRATGLKDNPQANAQLLKEFMTRIFPQLSSESISHVWSGLVAYTFDDLIFETKSLYNGNPWFMPAILNWHRLLDRFGY